MFKLRDLTGMKFGRLTVISRAPNKKNHTKWNCICECGNSAIVDAYALTKGLTRSCGCLASETAAKLLSTHGYSKTKLYSVYKAMRARCENPNTKHYEDYGGRGIFVCNEWKSNRVSFFKWAEENGYHEGLSIDRIDVDGNYEPSNCRWITMQEQQLNKRTNRILTINGVSKPCKCWADEAHISDKTLDKRLRLGWNNYDAVFKPIKKGSKRK